MHSEALGTVMIVHGEELGDESKFGMCVPCVIWSEFRTYVRPFQGGR